MKKTNRGWLVFLIVLSQAVFFVVVGTNWERLKVALILLVNVDSHRGPLSAERLVIGQFLFYLLGLAVAFVVIIDLIRLKDKGLNKGRWVSYGIYFILFIALELPLYHHHAGFAATQLHGHTFWTGFHVH